MKIPPQDSPSGPSADTAESNWQAIADLAREIAKGSTGAEIASRAIEPPENSGHATPWAELTGLETRSRDRLTRRPLVIGAILLCALLTFGLGLAFVNLNRWSDFGSPAANERGTGFVPSKPTGGDNHSGSTNRRTEQLDPEAAVLSIDQLPGYELINSAEAARPGGGAEPNSWDNLFEKSRPGARDYRVTEAIVVVYGTPAEAITEFEQLRQAEESHGAKASPGLVVNESTTWVEPLGVRGYALIRVVFRTANVVAQVALLGNDDPALASEVQNLAGAQQTRLQTLLSAGG